MKGNIKKTVEVAARFRGFIAQRFPEEPLENIFAALLLVAAECAHSQGMTNLEFRRTARDVYSEQLKAFEDMR